MSSILERLAVLETELKALKRLVWAVLTGTGVNLASLWIT